MWRLVKPQRVGRVPEVPAAKKRAMACATPPASLEARTTEAVATGPLGALSHDELGVIFDGLADPLQPDVGVALSSTCLGLRTPLQVALGVLRERYARAAALCRKVGTSCKGLRVADAEYLTWRHKGLTANDMVTLAMILQTNGLPRLRRLDLMYDAFGDAGVQALCEGLSHGVAPSLRELNLNHNNFGSAGAEALASTLRREALPKLSVLDLNYNSLDDLAALAPPLRKLLTLKWLSLPWCHIGDTGVASLFANLDKNEFAVLENLFLQGNKITDVGCATLVAALEADRLPRLFLNDKYLDKLHFLEYNHATASAIRAVQDPLVRRSR